MIDNSFGIQLLRISAAVDRCGLATVLNCHARLDSVHQHSCPSSICSLAKGALQSKVERRQLVR